MSLLQGSQLQSSVYLCTFQCLVREAQIMIKFPCCYFVEWATAAGKNLSITPKHKPENNHIYFNEKISLATEMIYNHKSQEYTKKESTVELFLVSKSRPDQNKLVGRVTVDLSKIVNVGMYAEPTEFKLNFCSVQGSITMQFGLLDQKLTSLKVQDLDRSSFIDYISQISLKNHKNGPFVIKNDENQLRQALPNQDRSYIRTSLEREVDRGEFLSIQREERPNQLEPYSKLALSSLNDSAKINPKQQLPNLTEIKKRITFGNNNDNQVALASLNNTQGQRVTTSIPNDKQLPKAKRLQFKDEVKELQLNVQRCESEHSNNDEPLVVSQQPHIPVQVKPQEAQLNTDSINRFNIQGNRRKDRRLISIEQSLLSQKKREAQQDKILKLKLESSQELQLVREEYQQKQQTLQTQNKELVLELQEKEKIIGQLKVMLEQNENKYRQLKGVTDELERAHLNLIQKGQDDKIQNTKMIESYQAEIAHLNSNLADYVSKLGLYEGKVINLEQMIKNLEEFNQKYQSELATSHQHKQQLEKQLALLQQDNHSLQARLQIQINLKNQYQRERPQTSEQNKDATQQILLLQESVQAWQGKNKQLQQEMEVVLLQYERKKQQYDALNQQHQELLLKLQSTHLQSQQVKEQQKESVSIGQEKIDNLNKHINNLNEHINSLNDNINSLNSQIKSQIQVKTGLNEEIVSLTQEVTKLRQKLALSEEQATRMNAQVQFLKMSLELNEKQYTDQIEQLKINKGILEQKLQQSLLKISELQVRQNSRTQAHPSVTIQDMHVQSNQENIKLSQKIEEINLALSQIALRNDELLRVNQKLTEDLSFYEKEFSGLKEENRLMKIQIENNRILNTQSGKPSKSQEELEQKCQQYEAMIEKLNSNLEEQINQNNQLSEIVIKYMEKQAKMKETITVLEEQSKEIFVLFQQKQHNEETYQAMIDNLQREIDRMRNNFNQIQSQEPSPTKSMYKSPKESIKESPIFEDDRDQAIKSLQMRNRQLQEKVQKLKQSHGQLMQAIDQLKIIKAEHTNLKMEFEFQLRNEEELKANYENMLNSYKSQFQTISNQLLQKNTLCNDLQQTIDRFSIPKSNPDLEQELVSLRSKYSQLLQSKTMAEKQLLQLKGEMELIQEDKFGLQSDNNQKDIKIIELQEEINQMVTQLKIVQTNTSITHSLSNDKIQEMYNSFASIRDRLVTSNIHNQWEALMKNLLDRSLGGEEASKIINIEEKSRLLSKQLQKLKAHILKSTSHNQQDKLAFMKDIKGCESIVSELIAAAQALNLNQSSFL